MTNISSTEGKSIPSCGSLCFGLHSNRDKNRTIIINRNVNLNHIGTSSQSSLIGDLLIFSPCLNYSLHNKYKVNYV